MPDNAWFRCLLNGRPFFFEQPFDGEPYFRSLLAHKEDVVFKIAEAPALPIHRHRVICRCEKAEYFSNPRGTFTIAFSSVAGIPMAHRYLVAPLAMALLGNAVAAELSSASEWRWEVEGGGVSRLETSIDSGGDVAIDRFVADLSASRRYASGTRVGIGVNYGQSRYDFSGAVQIGSADPWRRIQQASLSASVFYSLDDRWTLYGIPSLRFDGEEGVSFGDGDTLGLLAGASYRFSDRLTIGPGVGVFGELEDDTSLFPILIVDWKISESLSLETGRAFAASRGPGLQLRWRQSPEWEFAFGGRYEKQRFRLDDSGVAPDGVGEDSSIPLFALAQYRPSSDVTLSFIGGASTGGELRLEDAGGNVLASPDVDAAPFFGATLRIGL